MNEKKPKGSVWTILRDFIQETSISGISNAGKENKSLARRTVWFLIFVVGAVATGFSLISVIHSILNYPTTTSVTVKHNSRIAFPGVTICNQNRVDCWAMKRVLQACQHQENKSYTVNCPALAYYLNGKNKTELYSASQVTEICGQLAQDCQKLFEIKDDSCLDIGPEGPPDNQVDADSEFLTNYMLLNRTTREIIGYQFNNLVMGCTFLSQSCSDTMFQKYLSPTYGNCYMFNAKTNDSYQEQYVAQTGPLLGMSLVINLNQSTYINGGQTQQAGARLVVHPITQAPLVDERGVDLQPNTLTQIAIQENKINRLPSPYLSKCYSTWDQSDYPEITDQQPYLDYTVAQCERNCISTKMVELCHCFHPLYLDFEYMRNGTPPCDMTSNSSGTQCFKELNKNMTENESYCNCNVECEEISFDLSLSISSWPSDQYLGLAMQAYGFEVPSISNDDGKDENLDDSKSDSSSGTAGKTDSQVNLIQRRKRSPGTIPSKEEMQERLKNNLLKVNIYLKTKNSKIVDESATYNLITGLYAIGGAVSLFLGISISMVFEVFELFYDVAISLITKLGTSPSARKKDGKSKNFMK